MSGWPSARPWVGEWLACTDPGHDCREHVRRGREYREQSPLWGDELVSEARAAASRKGGAIRGAQLRDRQVASFEAAMEGHPRPCPCPYHVNHRERQRRYYARMEGVGT